MSRSLTSWLPLVAFAALGAVLYLLLGFDALAAAPGLGAATLATGPVDMRQMIEAIKSGVDSMRNDTAAQVAELRREIERVEAKGNVAGLVSGAPGSRAGGAASTPSERKAFAQYLRTGQKEFALQAQAKQVSVGVPGEGGLAVPTWFDSEVASLVKEAAPLVGMVRRRRVSNFPARHIVTDRGMASGFVQETAARVATNTPGVLAVEPPYGEWYANPQITQWALDDISFNVVEWIEREIARELSAMQQLAIVSGNGINKPKGFLDAPIVTTNDNLRAFGSLQYFPTGVSGALPATAEATINLLMDVVHGMHQFYRARASWVMSAPVLNVLRRTRDADGRPLLLDSLVSQAPATLLGYPVVECEDMPPPAATSLSIAFGDFDSGYVLDEHEAGLRVVQDPYTNKPYVGFYSTMRFGGSVLDSNAIKLIRFAAS